MFWSFHRQGEQSCRLGNTKTDLRSRVIASWRISLRCREKVQGFSARYGDVTGSIMYGSGGRMGCASLMVWGPVGVLRGTGPSLRANGETRRYDILVARGHRAFRLRLPPSCCSGHGARRRPMFPESLSPPWPFAVVVGASNAVFSVSAWLCFPRRMKELWISPGGNFLLVQARSGKPQFGLGAVPRLTGREAPWRDPSPETSLRPLTSFASELFM